MQCNTGTLQQLPRIEIVSDLSESLFAECHDPYANSWLSAYFWARVTVVALFVRSASLVTGLVGHAGFGLFGTAMQQFRKKHEMQRNILIQCVYAKLFTPQLSERKMHECLDF